MPSKPPGSACSIVIGDGTTTMAPGSQQNLQMVIKDTRQAHDELTAKGVAMSDVAEMPWGIFTYFSDPDGVRVELIADPLGEMYGTKVLQR